MDCGQEKRLPDIEHASRHRLTSKSHPVPSPSLPCIPSYPNTEKARPDMGRPKSISLVSLVVKRCFSMPGVMEAYSFCWFYFGSCFLFLWFSMLCYCFPILPVAFACSVLLVCAFAFRLLCFSASLVVCFAFLFLRLSAFLVFFLPSACV